MRLVSDEWMMADMRGSRGDRQDLTRAMGRESSRQVAGLDLQMRPEISEGSERWKLEKG